MTLDQFKRVANIHASITRHDVTIAEKIETATIMFEREAGYLARQAAYVLTLDGPYTTLRLPLRPVKVIGTITADGIALVEDTDYTAQIDLKGFCLLTFATQRTNLEIAFDVGHGLDEDDESTAPQDVKQAVISLASHLFKTTEAWTSDLTEMRSVPRTFQSTVLQYRIA